jgi:purine-nucleoside phosphorylase
MDNDRITKYELDEVCDFFDRQFTFINHVDLVIQLGSGHHAEGLLDEVWNRCPLLDLPYMPDEPTVARHNMEVLWGIIGGARVLVFSGRFHCYDGFGRIPIILPIWAAVESGARNCLLCNSAGGIDEDLQPGTFMLVEDHIDTMSVSALAGHQHLLRSPFIDMSDVYDPALGGALMYSARELGLQMHRGIYWASKGPQFETPAETQLAHQLGASALGKSTVMEATIAHALDARVVALSLIAGRASGLTRDRRSHEETIARGYSYSGNLVQLIRRWVTNEGKKYLQ